MALACANLASQPLGAMTIVKSVPRRSKSRGPFQKAPFRDSINCLRFATNEDL